MEGLINKLIDKFIIKDTKSRIKHCNAKQIKGNIFLLNVYFEEDLKIIHLMSPESLNEDQHILNTIQEYFHRRYNTNIMYTINYLD